MQCYCFQDHNYGAPPPPTPPQSPPPQVKGVINGHVQLEEVVSTTSTAAATAIVPLPKDDKFDDSITRCVCQFQHDDGYMICCDKCRYVKMPVLQRFSLSGNRLVIVTCEGSMSISML